MTICDEDCDKNFYFCVDYEKAWIRIHVDFLDWIRILIDLNSWIRVKSKTMYYTISFKVVTLKKTKYTNVPNKNK